MLEGLFLGVITWLSMVLSFAHFPKRIKTFFKNHFLLTDLFATLFAYFSLTMISKSIVAMVGAMIAGLLVNFSIYFLRYTDETK